MTVHLHLRYFALDHRIQGEENQLHHHSEIKSILYKATSSCMPHTHTDTHCIYLLSTYQNVLVDNIDKKSKSVRINMDVTVIPV